MCWVMQPTLLGTPQVIEKGCAEWTHAPPLGRRSGPHALSSDRLKVSTEGDLQLVSVICAFVARTNRHQLDIQQIELPQGLKKGQISPVPGVSVLNLLRSTPPGS